MKKGNSIVLILLILSFVVSSCAPMHRIVKVKGVKDEEGKVNYLYGVTYNNTLIPEYTQTTMGTYADSYEEASELLDKRREDIDPWIDDKYELTNSTWFQLTNGISRLGLLAISPIVVPIEWLGEKLFPDPDLGPARSWKQIAEDFFEEQYDEPVLKARALADNTPAEVTNL